MTVLSGATTNASGTDTSANDADLTATAETFDSLEPATGRVLASYPIATQAAVEAAVARARDASHWWGSLSFDERRRHLSAWRAMLARRMTELGEVVSAETGKPRDDAISEI